MSKYTGPRLKIIRRLGFLSGFTTKNIKNRLKTPGQHGLLLLTRSKRSSISDDYRLRLIEKQKLRFTYGLSESQLFYYYQKARQKKNITGDNLLELLESRLDCLIYRLGFAPTIFAARQIVNHGHILVNNNKVTIPSFLCSINDLISIKNQSKNFILTNFKIQQERRALIANKLKQLDLLKARFSDLLPTHVEINEKELTARICSVVKKKEILAKIDELKVVEYYSK